MKKNYLEPQMEVIRMETAQMIAESFTTTTDTTKGFGESLSSEFHDSGSSNEDW